MIRCLPLLAAAGLAAAEPAADPWDAARAAAGRGEWEAAARLAGGAIDPARAGRDQVAFLAAAAARAGDWRLAALACQFGILRWSDDHDLRRSELAVLAHAGRAGEALGAARALLERLPGERELWSTCAWAAQESGQTGLSRAALEAALLLAPGDAAARHALAAAQLAGGQPQAALATLGQPRAGERETAVLGVRAADAAGDPRRGQAWLACIPAAERDRDLGLLAARLALQAGDAVAARAALDRLVALGEDDPAVLAWAAALAEQAGEAARAEALYRAAASGAGAAAPSAGLHLAAFLVRQGRLDEARTRLREHLAARPGDGEARALLDHLAGGRGGGGAPTGGG